MIAGMGLVVVDDHRIVRQTLCRTLERSGARVLAQLDDGEAVVRVVRECGPDAVVLDIGLPHVDGFEAARRVRAAGLDVCIVILSARDDAETVRTARAAGADAFVPKGGGSVDDLVHALGRARRRGRRSVRHEGRESELANRLAELTAQEWRVLMLVADGWSSVQIGAHLGISPKTVANHRQSIMNKLRVHSAAELTRIVDLHRRSGDDDYWPA